VVVLLALDEEVHGLGVLVVVEEVLGALGQQCWVRVAIAAERLYQRGQGLEQLRGKAQLHGAIHVARFLKQCHRLLRLAALLKVRGAIQHHIRRRLQRQVHELGVHPRGARQPRRVSVPSRRPPPPPWHLAPRTYAPNETLPPRRAIPPQSPPPRRSRPARSIHARATESLWPPDTRRAPSRTRQLTRSTAPTTW